MRDETITIITAMVTIATLEIINLILTGLDSTLFSLVVSSIAGLAGYLFGYSRKIRRKKKEKKVIYLAFKVL